MANVEIKLTESDLDAIAEKVAAKLASTLASMPVNGNGPTKEFWKEPEAAGVLGVSKYSLARWRRDGHIAAASDKRPIRYSQENLDAVKEWLRTR